MTLICGRYEGFDERVRAFVDEEISLGDFVLTGGEVAAMAIIEGVIRLLPGVLGNEASTTEESHSPDTEGMLEYPHYTRPVEFRGERVPEVLMGGNHGEIARYRREQAYARTRERRPDLLPDASDPGPPSAGRENEPISIALVHLPVLDRQGATITTAITNLDLHDLARSACTYGVRSFFIVHPVEAQRELALRVKSHWTSGSGSVRIPTREPAMKSARDRPRAGRCVCGPRGAREHSMCT